MKKRRTSYSTRQTNDNPLENVDRETYMDLVDNGYNDEEIAREFNVSNSFFKRLKEESRSDY